LKVEIRIKTKNRIEDIINKNMEKQSDKGKRHRSAPRSGAVNPQKDAAR
jgi:hypothetical protein